MGKVYFVNGFLDAGKTTFIQDLLEEDYFEIKGKTLLIQCEEGEVEYDDYLLNHLKVTVKKIENEEDFDTEHIVEFEKEVMPERIIVEFNGMWNRKNLVFPEHWDDIMEIVIIDASTFEIFAANMKSFMSEHVRKAYLTIFNNCDDVMDKMASYRRSVKAVNPSLNIVCKDKHGEDILQKFEDDLPYSLDDEVIDVRDDKFSVFYLDSLDNLVRYLGKKIVFTAQIMKAKEEGKDIFLAGRFAMTCCEQDISLFGIICHYNGTDSVENDDWVEITGTVDKEYVKQYDVEFPVCIVESIRPCDKPKREVISVI